MSYYKKKTVYADSPLKEIIYELEDAVEYNSFLELAYVPKDKLREIIDRHDETVNEFKKRLSQLIN